VASGSIYLSPLFRVLCRMQGQLKSIVHCGRT